MWSDDKLRQVASDTLIALLNGANKDLVRAVMDIFRVNDQLTPDISTVRLLSVLAAPETDMSAVPSFFVVERLQTLLPHEAQLVATIAHKLITAWRSELGNMQTEIAAAAPQLVDLALTLHRLGGESRQAGISLFEFMIEMDAYGARQTLFEIDGRFGTNQTVARQRRARTPKIRNRHR